MSLSIRPYIAKILTSENEYICTNNECGEKFWFDKEVELKCKYCSSTLEKIKKGDQLFICSKDIQVGDKFIHKTDSTNTEHICINRPHYLHVIGDDHISYMRSFCFKVIGLVSSSAIWVKDGNEFEEHEIEVRKICWDDSCSPYDSYCSHCSRSNLCGNTEGNEVLIKGPICECFH